MLFFFNCCISSILLVESSFAFMFLFLSPLQSVVRRSEGFEPNRLVPCLFICRLSLFFFHIAKKQKQKQTNKQTNKLVNEFFDVVDLWVVKLKKSP